MSCTLGQNSQNRRPNISELEKKVLDWDFWLQVVGLLSSRLKLRASWAPGKGATWSLLWGLWPPPEVEEALQKARWHQRIEGRALQESEASYGQTLKEKRCFINMLSQTEIKFSVFLSSWELTLPLVCNLFLKIFVCILSAVFPLFIQLLFFAFILIHIGVLGRNKYLCSKDIVKWGIQNQVDSRSKELWYLYKGESSLTSCLLPSSILLPPPSGWLSLHSSPIQLFKKITCHFKKQEEEIPWWSSG